MRRKRVYVAIPLTHRRNRAEAQHICEFLTKQGVEVTSPWVAEEDAKQGLNPKQVYQRDIDALTVSDAIIAEVSTPSFGVGMELMAAIKSGTPIACLHEKKMSVSWMVLGAPGVHLVTYPLGCIDEGLKNVATWLRSIPLCSGPQDINTTNE